MDTQNWTVQLYYMALQFYNSLFFSVIKFIIGIYVIVVFVDIVLLLAQRSIAGDIRETMLGINMPRELVASGKKKKLRIKWGKIKSRLESDREADYKLAVMEADYLIDDLIRRMGYTGENMSERLDNVPAGQLENHPEELKKAHEVRNRIIHEDAFRLDQKTARETLALYEEFLRHFEVLD